MLEDQVGEDSFLARGLLVDLQDPSLSVTPQVPRRKDPQPRKSQADGAQVQYTQRYEPHIHKIDMRLKVCIAQCNHFRKHGKAYRQRHLYQRLDAAKEKEENKAAKQILAIIQREKDRSFWC
jgi:hypothetical protein